MVLLKKSLSQRYLNFKFEKFDFAGSQIFFISLPIKKLTQIFGLCSNCLHICFKKFNILFQGKERLAETKLMPAKLYAVLA